MPTVAALEQTEATTMPADVAAYEDTDENAHRELLEQDLLVEDVSIDGMCGVY